MSFSYTEETYNAPQATQYHSVPWVPIPTLPDLLPLQTDLYCQAHSLQVREKPTPLHSSPFMLAQQVYLISNLQACNNGFCQAQPHLNSPSLFASPPALSCGLLEDMPASSQMLNQPSPMAPGVRSPISSNSVGEEMRKLVREFLTLFSTSDPKAIQLKSHLAQKRREQNRNAQKRFRTKEQTNVHRLKEAIKCKEDELDGLRKNNEVLKKMLQEAMLQDHDTLLAVERD